MIVNSLQINEALQLTPLASEQIAEASQNSDARIWLDLQDPGPAELEEWLDTLGVTNLTRRLIMEGRDRSGFYPLKREILFVFPVLTGTEGPFEVDHVAFLCRENLLLTMHRTAILDPQELAAVEYSESWLPARSVVGLISAVMIDLSMKGLQRTNALRGSILALEERMDRDPDTVEVEEILELRSELLSLGAVVTDQLPSMQALNATEKRFFKLEDARDYMNCALVNLQAADGALDWLDQRLGALRSSFQMHAQDKTNRRLGMLTILSAIFMPITLLAGIWGMNFETMPELKFPFSYPIALGFMAVIGWGMYRYFRRTGWFD